MKTILVTGGCGYIGSHTIVELIQSGYKAISLDNLSNSSEQVLKGIKEITGVQVENFRLDVNDKAGLRTLFSSNQIDGVIHFAALKAVNESVHEPLLYYRNNIGGLIALVEVMQEFNCRNLIFSSSCSVYGNSKVIPVTESTPVAEPESPYARTKLMGEQILTDIARADAEMQIISLRYFNPAGAHPSNVIGESPTVNASNLVPVTTETAIGLRESLTVFGEDYPTRDGTCIRDYIHVTDIANAHVLAMNFILSGKNEKNYDVFNLGTGVGNTVLEVLHTFERVNQSKVNYIIGPRRAGDVIAIYANNEKARNVLGWQLRYNLEDIMRTAWLWEQKRRGND
jgi:UDP-glucose 4-epimerase